MKVHKRVSKAFEVSGGKPVIRIGAAGQDRIYLTDLPDHASVDIFDGTTSLLIGTVTLGWLAAVPNANHVISAALKAEAEETEKSQEMLGVGRNVS